jgi:hypothetical protein
MIRAISSLSSLEASIGSLFVGVGSSFSSSVALNATDCIQGNRRKKRKSLHLGHGGRTLLQVDNVFGVFDYKFKVHKLANHLLGRHLLIPRISMN